MQITISAYPLAHTPSLPKRSQSQRLVAASSAIGISFALLGVFTLSPRFSSINMRESNHSAMQFFWVGQSSKESNSNPTPLAHSDTKAISQSNSKPTQSKTKVKAARSPSERITLSKTEAQAIHELPKEPANSNNSVNNSANSVASETAPALSSKILGDKEALKRAYLDSRSEIQKMADNSGKSLTAPHSTKFDQFQTAASAAAKKDCLSANSVGGGLLGIPLLAAMAALDKCK
jgi:hypothetical protein